MTGGGKEVPGGMGLPHGSAREAMLRQSGDPAMRRELRIRDRALFAIDRKLREAYEAWDAMEDKFIALAKANDTDGILHAIQEMADAPARNDR